MSTVAKVFVVLNLILAVAFCGAAAAFLGWDDWHNKERAKEQKAAREALELVNKDLTEIRNNYNQAVVDRDAANGARQRLEGENLALKAAYDQMVKSYGELNASATYATRALLVAQSTIKEKNTLTDQLMAERQKLVEETKRFQEERDGAVAAQRRAELDLANAMTNLQDTQGKLHDKEVEFERLDFRYKSLLAAHPDWGTGLEQPMQRAKVLAADDATNVVVISLGAEDGVKEGFRYTVSRGNEYVGEIQIDHVEGKMASGKVNRATQKLPVQKGDDAMTPTGR